MIFFPLNLVMPSFSSYSKVKEAASIDAVGLFLCPLCARSSAVRGSGISLAGGDWSVQLG